MDWRILFYLEWPAYFPYDKHKQFTIMEIATSLNYSIHLLYFLFAFPENI